MKRQCFTGRTVIRSDQGFTLIELLIVIAFIALLAGLLLPALSGARQRGLIAVCMSQIHQLQIAFQMYAHDHQDVVPKCSGAGFQGQTPENPSWCARTMGYETGTNPQIPHSDATNTWLTIKATYGSIGPYTNPGTELILLFERVSSSKFSGVRISDRGELMHPQVVGAQQVERVSFIAVPQVKTQLKGK